jgi:hypothetical protein
VSTLLHAFVHDFITFAECTGTVKVKVKVTLQLTVSVSQGIEPILGLVIRYYFLSEGCFLKFAVLSFWGALSDERSGLICLSRSTNLPLFTSNIYVTCVLIANKVGN